MALYTDNVNISENVNDHFCFLTFLATDCNTEYTGTYRHIHNNKVLISLLFDFSSAVFQRYEFVSLRASLLFFKVCAL